MNWCNMSMLPTNGDVGDFLNNIDNGKLICEAVSFNESIGQPGPDGWPILSLKETASQISLSLSILFKKSLNSSHIPVSWKHVHVTPIHKKDSHSVADNYRPISLTSPII